MKHEEGRIMTAISFQPLRRECKLHFLQTKTVKTWDNNPATSGFSNFNRSGGHIVSRRD